MYTAVLAFAGAASAAAIAPRQAAASKCCFGINVAGGVSNGGLGQFTDGQNRVGPGYSGANSAQYCYYAAQGSIVDASGRGCVISAPTNQYQCDAGVTAATAASGITIAANNSIEHNGNAVWYECYSTAGQGIYNIYASNPGSQALDCHPITLTTVDSNCTSAAASSSAAASTSSVASVSSASASSAAASSSKASSIASASSSTAVPTTSVKTSTVVLSSTAPAPVSSSGSVAPPPPATTPKASSSFSAPPPPPPATTPVAPPPAVSTCVASTVTLPRPAASTYTVIHTVTVMPSCPAAPACTPVAPSSAPVVSSPAASSSPSAPLSPVAPSSAKPSTSAATSTVARTSTVVVPASSVPISSASSKPAASASSAPAASVSSKPAVPASSAPAASASVAPPAPAASACPKGIAGNTFEYPHLIVPVNKDSPTTAYGTQYFAGVNSTFSTIFNFDIPQSLSGKTCSLEFLLPNKKDLTTSDYTLTGSGAIDFQQLAGPATQSTTYASQPKVAKDLGVFPITPGSATIVASGPCAAGMTVTYELVAQDSTALHFFEDYNPAALGLYVVAC